MIYIIDAGFALFFLILKMIAISYFEHGRMDFMRSRKYYHLFEFGIVMFGVHYMPHHSIQQSFIGFCICMAIWFIFFDLKPLKKLIDFLIETIKK